MRMKCLRFFVVLYVASFPGREIFAWNANLNSVFSARNVLPLKTGLKSDLIESIANGAETAIEHCRKIFRWDRWNCPDSTFSRKSTQMITKELAFAQAIVSAGVTHSVVRDCSRGILQECGCAPPPNTREIKNFWKDDQESKSMIKKNQKVDWTWGGCSDNVEYGQEISKKFLDDLEEGNDPQADVHLHNNLIGRTIIKDTMIKKCRCHGLSGSCSLQTCWMQVSPFSVVAKILKNKYKKAKMIDFGNIQRNVPSSHELEDWTENQKGKNKLVFLEKSPNYCAANSTMGWEGTNGRTCSRTRGKSVSREERKSCRNLCKSCGHRVRKQQKTISERCKCVFKWCCEVKCEICTKTVEEFFCD